MSSLVTGHRGYFSIGIQHGKTEENYGSLFRTAQILGANYLFTVGRRYKPQYSDSMKSWRHLPTFSYDTFEQFYETLPYDCRLIGIEMDSEAVPLERYVHPARACYLLGAEDHGLTKEALLQCHELVRLQGERSMNVAVAGSIVLYHRIMQMGAI